MPIPPDIGLRIDRDGPSAKLADYWRARVEQHTSDSYLDIQMSKFPEDLRVYEHLLWEMQATVVIEIGCQFGGSTLWFRDRLRTQHHYRPDLAGPKVIAVDIDSSRAFANLEKVDSAWREDIELVEGDVADPKLADHVRSLVPADANVLVVEDSAHEYGTTMQALTLYSPFVRAGGFVVVEDGCVDIEWMRPCADWPRGVLPAVNDWLETDAGMQFTVRRDLEIYGVTCHPHGILQRTSVG